MDYKKRQIDEILFLVNRNFSYSDIISMPVYLRRYFIGYIQELEEEKQK